MSVPTPADEKRHEKGPERLWSESWYMDWFDGASIRVNDDVIYHLCEMFLECSEKQDPCDIWKLEELEIMSWSSRFDAQRLENPSRGLQNRL